MIKRRLILFLLATLIISLMFWGAPGPLLRVYASSYQDKIISTFGEDLLGYWPLNEETGTTAYDVSGHGHNLTYYGVTLAQIAGPGATMGNAGLWDGINDYVQGASAEDTNELTIAVWVQSKGMTSGYPHLVGPLKSGEDHTLNWRESDSRIFYKRHVTGQAINLLSTDPLSLDQWHLIIGTTTVSGAKLSLYIATTGIDNPIAPLSGSTSTAFCVGDILFYGYFQHAMLIGRAISSEEVAIINDTNPPPTPTNTPVPSATFTLRPPQLILTLQNGNQWELDYTINAGQIATFIPGLILVAFLIVIVFFKLVKR
jgi:hypothetical protein